jgi:dipeptidyl aminopeptidase/acylaminoacyl peptidase
MTGDRPGATRPDRPPRRGRSAARIAAIGAVVVVVLWGTGCMESLFYVPTREPTPLPAGFPGAEAVSFDSADGTRLHGWFLPAIGPRSGRAAPTVLQVHGNAGSIRSHLWFTEYLPAAGFNLFIFDYRGYGQSEGTPRRRDDLIADTDAALDALLARDDVDPQRVGMFGQSLGGSIGLNAMAEREEIRAAVVVAAFTSWRDMAADAVSGGRSGPIARTLARVLIRDHRRPDECIARIDRPVLLVHGDDDRIVPMHHTERLAAAKPDATMLVLPGGRHNDLRDSHPELDARVVEFLSRHLGPRDEGDADRGGPDAPGS